MPEPLQDLMYVTGAGSGIGRAVAVRLAARGDVVALFDRSEDGLRATAEAIRSEGGKALELPGDVSDDEAVARSVRSAVEQHGPLRGVVACAGIAVLGTAIELTPEEWRRTLDVNLTGMFHTARHTIPELLASGGGSFTAIASDAGFRGAQGYAAYGASKHGVVGLVRGLALDHGPQGVRSNAICPGFVETPMVDQIFAEVPAEERAFYERSVPLGRFALPEEVAGVAAHLSSADGAYTNGLVYALDGGAHAGYFEAPTA